MLCLKGNLYFYCIITMLSLIHINALLQPYYRALKKFEISKANSHVSYIQQLSIFQFQPAKLIHRNHNAMYKRRQVFMEEKHNKNEKKKIWLNIKQILFLSYKVCFSIFIILVHFYQFSFYSLFSLEFTVIGRWSKFGIGSLTLNRREFHMNDPNQREKLLLNSR